MTLFPRVLSHQLDKSSDRLTPTHSNSSLRTASSTHHSSSHSHSSAPSYSLAITLESPPVILYGQPNESTGSIISGLLSLGIKSKSNNGFELYSVSSNSSLSSLRREPPVREEVELELVTLSLVQTIKYTKPFLTPSSSVANCKDCVLKKNVLARWDVLTSKASFSVGSHAYPFSYLLPGSLPASTKLGSSHSNSFIKYDLIAIAKRPNSAKETVVKLPLNISRSILRGPDRNSLRVFPPTEVTASAVLPNVIYPKSTFPIELKLDNIVCKRGDRRWRMRKLSWRIEELTKVKANTCSKHAPKLKAIEQSQRRTALHRELKTDIGTSAAAGNSPSLGSGQNKTANLHHSTIQTNMTLSTSPSNQFHSDLNTETPSEEQQEIVEEPISGPSHAHESFIEDFVPVNSFQSTSESTSSAVANTPSTNPVSTSEPPPIANEESIYLEEIRTVNNGEIKSGWKSDYSGRGKIELVADISIINVSTGLIKHITKGSSEDPKIDENHEGLRNGANVSCDIDDPSLGVYVSHTLIVEVVVAEEVIHNSDKKPSQKRTGSFSNLAPITSTSSTNSINDQSNKTSTPEIGIPTGAAKVLRMQFRLILTERSGLGIPWDDEVPPTYEDVRTLSPPTYQETSNSSTPSITPTSNITPPPVAAYRQTPGVIYGVGDTPGVGSFGLRNQPPSTLSIDHLVDLDERIQDFSL